MNDYLEVAFLVFALLSGVVIGRVVNFSWETKDSANSAAGNLRWIIGLIVLLNCAGLWVLVLRHNPDMPLFENVDSYRGIFEIVYFICGGPILVGVAMFGLRQIKVGMAQLKATERIAEIQNKRDSIKVTTEQMQYFSDKVLSKVSPLRSKGYTADRLIGVTINDGQIKFNLRKKGVMPEIKQQLSQHGAELLMMANALELFSVNFTWGLANEEMAFNTCGAAYCEAYEMIIPVLWARYPEYEQVHKLYDLWKLRVEKEKLIDKQAVLEDQISKISLPQATAPLI